ncbi:MAG: hypothetical protein DWQ36_07110 [Acidobacteria bacterium]|nr:MAG: hypothetical protein DWQ30_24545 [Acidobacteriota bacterium]REK09362.1 MAG: hypothetical protein DWQ36_07110 [Acidobacteriota bacterium]
MPQEIPQSARDAAREGRKIEAIKIVRRELGVDLAQAKEAVDSFLAATSHELDAGTGRSRLGQVDTRMPQAALDALQRGEKIEAIKIARQHFGIGLKEAKEAVERLGSSPRPEGPTPDGGRRRDDTVRSGCGAYVALAVVSGTLVLHLLL